MNYTDEQIEAFEAKLIKFSPGNIFVAAYLARWAGASQAEKVAIMREVDESAKRIVAEFGQIGETAQKAGASIVSGIGNGLFSKERGA